MNRSLSESQEHQDLVSMMIRHFEKEGYRKINADIPGMTKPATIYGTERNHIPDRTAMKNGTFIILEAETSSTIFDDHTISQWSLFVDAARNGGGESHVVVPEGSVSVAEQRTARLGIRILFGLLNNRF